MIKYLEMTAPDSKEFRQAKILSIEVAEGAQVVAGDALFKVMSGNQEIDLPSLLSGKIVEVIAVEGETISTMSPLVLIETEVEKSTATINPKTAKAEQSLAPDELAKKQTKKKKKKKKIGKKVSKKTKKTDNQKTDKKQSKKQSERASAIIKHQQQQLDLSGGDALKHSDNSDNTADSVAEKVGDSVIAKLVNSAPDAEDLAASANTTSPVAAETLVDVVIPDIGGEPAKIIEILVSTGQDINIEDPLITLESDKASMDVPSSAAGKLQSIEVRVNQEVDEGTIIAKVLSRNSEKSAAATEAAVPTKHNISTQTEKQDTPITSAIQKKIAPAVNVASSNKSHASPSIRRLARELGVIIGKVSGSGRKGRITEGDVKSFVKGVMITGGSGIPPIPAQDFSKFGEIDIQPLNRIKRLTAKNLSRSWLNVPHVTHNDESNINDLDSFRKQLNAEYEKQNKGTKLSPLAFIVKAVVNALQAYPQFNSSLDETGENLIYKQYFNIGIAVETPNGLVVPVIKGADKMNVTEIATEMGMLASKARNKKLTGADMSGACFTISSLGGIGGTHFTPIVNAPEVAILGVSRSKMQPIWDGSEFQPGMILPLSLSYDHRVIDGAEAARFTRHIAAALEDVRRLTI